MRQYPCVPEKNSHKTLDFTHLPRSLHVWIVTKVGMWVVFADLINSTMPISGNRFKGFDYVGGSKFDPSHESLLITQCCVNALPTI